MKMRNFLGKENEITAVTVHASGINIRIQLWCEDGPYSTLTVNLGEDAGNSSILMPYCGFVDVNNNPYAIDFIRECGLGEPYTRFGDSIFKCGGYCSYPLYQFNRDKLAELDPEGCAKYEASYKANVSKAIAKLLKGGVR